MNFYLKLNDEHLAELLQDARLNRFAFSALAQLAERRELPPDFAEYSKHELTENAKHFHQLVTELGEEIQRRRIP